MLTPFLLAAAALAADPKPDTYTVVRCGHLLAVAGRPTMDNATLLIKNDRVERVFAGFDGPDLAGPKAAGATVTEVDLKTSWVLPGLIDCHVHLTNQWDETVRQRFTTESSEFVALRGAVYAKRTVEAGFTTVRDLGAFQGAGIFAIRDAVNAGLIVGPRIIAAGHPIAITGGHGDSTLGYAPGIFPEQTPKDGIADGPDECAKAVRTQVKLGADVIKLTATGGVLSASTAGLAQHFSDEELTAIVRTAHSLGRKVAAHAHGVDGINAALRAGVDSIEHGTYLDDKSIDLFKQHNAYHVPTLLAGFTVENNAKKPGFYLPMVASKAAIVGPKVRDMFKKSHEAGVKIAFGTDTGVSPHGENAREFKLMVDAGMTPVEAITSATVTASELLGLEKEIGTLESGKAADLIAVAKDPVGDITELERVKFVMKSGKVVKNDR